MATQRINHQLVPIFNGENYDFWVVKMKTTLKSRDLWDIVENGPAKSAPTTSETSATGGEPSKEEIIKDQNALQILQNAMTDPIFSRIVTAKTAKEAWDTLNTEFQGSAQVRGIKLQTLRAEFENLVMSNDENINQYFSRVTGIANQMRIYGEDVRGKNCFQNAQYRNEEV